MVVTQHNLAEILPHIDPARLDYTEWLNVGMALKDSGYTAAEWDEWSRRDSARYHPGECFHKWDSFRGAALPVTGGTIIQMAREQGWTPPGSGGSYKLEWDATNRRKG